MAKIARNKIYYRICSWHCGLTNWKQCYRCIHVHTVRLIIKKRSQFFSKILEINERRMHFLEARQDSRKQVNLSLSHKNGASVVVSHVNSHINTYIFHTVYRWAVSVGVLSAWIRAYSLTRGTNMNRKPIKFDFGKNVRGRQCFSGGFRRNARR